MILLLICVANGQNNFYKVSSCTDINLKDLPEELFERCKEPDTVPHCLTDSYGNLGVSCFRVTLIKPGNYYPFLQVFSIQMPLE